ncbi:MAG: TIGR02147 family protein [Bdellovibrionales bacterium]|nr:TIGR02147 family protein [Bdellovibrionales bacterium]
MLDLFEYEDYKNFLNQKLDELDHGGRGARARMSRTIGCQTAYTAQVLRGNAHFSLEHGEAINDFLGHTDSQGQYFLLLIQYAKAGTPKLQNRFHKQIAELQKSHTQIKNQLGIGEHLVQRDQQVYYSSWVYGAIHALVSIPGHQSAESIASRLGIETKKAAEALDFLYRAQLLEKNKRGELSVGKRQIHLGADSPFIGRHHVNWRLQSILAIENQIERGLHYSSVISISKKDQSQIRQKIVNTLAALKPLIRESKEEELCSLCFDFFPL